MTGDVNVNSAPRRSRLRWLKFLLVPAFFLASLAVMWPALTAQRLARQIEVRGGIGRLSSDSTEWSAYHLSGKRLPNRICDRLSAFFSDRLVDCDLDGSHADVEFIKSVCSTGTLTTLYLNDSAADDSVAPFIALNHLMKILTLERTKITGGTAEKLQGLSQLTDLSLRETAICDDDLRFLSRLPLLNSLDIGKTHITSRALRHLTSLSKLWYLDLDRTDIDDEAMQIVAKCPSLTWLNVKSCRITDRGLEFLAASSSVTDIFLADTLITAEGLTALAKLPTLETVGISKDQIRLLRDVNFDSFRKKIGIYVNCSRSEVDGDKLTFLVELERMEKIELSFVSETWCLVPR